jgi:phosphoribosylformimino-5-aminoimidazole carboxamide ribotide isomerase
MLIPSIDLMGGKIVQLVHGERKALEFDDFEEWVDRFAPFPLVQLIDLDAAMGRGENRKLVAEFARRLPCQVGGGIRSIETAKEILATCARRVILGSSLICDGKPNVAFAREAAEMLGSEKLVFAVDTKQGRVAIRGWRELTEVTAIEMIGALEPWCDAFLYTHVDTEGSMRGIPLDVVRVLRDSTTKQLIAAGGIATNEEIDRLHAMNVDAVVGMAIYTGKLNLEVAESNRKLRFHRSDLDFQ